MSQATNVSLNLIVRYRNIMKRLILLAITFRMAIDHTGPSFIIIIVSHKIKTRDKNAYRNAARNGRTDKAKLCLHAAPT